MLTKMYIRIILPLWKTLVEKPVENVENYVLSTAIYDVSRRTPPFATYAYAFV